MGGGYNTYETSKKFLTKYQLQNIQDRNQSGEAKSGRWESAKICLKEKC
jgi:hypothetical protein